MSNNKTLRQWLAQIEPWWMVLVLLFIYMISILDRLVINMLVVPIQADMGFSDVQMSLLLGPAFALCNGLFGLPLGWAADRYSRRWVVFGGLVFWSCRPWPPALHAHSHRCLAHAWAWALVRPH